MIKVWIKKKTFNKFIQETNKWFPLETGGILLGYKDKNNDIVVVKLIEAGPNAVRKNYFFNSDGDFQQLELSKIYIRSKGVVTYLGDWHSHPLTNSYMSFLDRKTICKIAKTETSKETNPIFIVVGTSPFEVKCWRYNENRNNNLEPLKIKLY